MSFGSLKKVSPRMRFVLLNAIMLGALFFHGSFRSDLASIVGVISGLAIMNLVAWISSRYD